MSNQFTKQGNIICSSTDLTNIYSGKQYNASYCAWDYNFKTDIFKDYGFNSAYKLSPNNVDGTTLVYGYSYLLDSTVVYNTNSTFWVSMYAYVSSDCNANFKLTLEHNNTWVKNYQNTTSNITDSTKGSVIWVWGEFKPSPNDGKIYIMFYPIPHTANTFTTGYQLIAGITIYEGSKLYRPLIYDTHHCIYTCSDKCTIHNNDFLDCNDIIEY